MNQYEVHTNDARNYAIVNLGFFTVLKEKDGRWGRAHIEISRYGDSQINRSDAVKQYRDAQRICEKLNILIDGSGEVPSVIEV